MNFDYTDKVNDLRTRLSRVKHGRAWDIHVWISPEGGRPKAAIFDPWNRWNDAADSLSLDDRAFFYPETELCGCP